MVNRYEHVRAALMMSDAFSNTKTSVLGDREHKPRLLPQNLNGAEHMAHRRILNPWFGPVAIDRTESLARRRCQELLDGLMRVGHTDLVSEFALQYPTEIFLAHLGLPIEDGVVLLPLVEAMFRGFFCGDPAELAETVLELKAYFQRQFDDRSASPRPVETDFVTWVMAAEIDTDAR